MKPMTDTVSMPNLQRALDQESYEWMAANVPDVLKALEREMASGRTPRQAKMFVLREYGREELAQRIEQAARHIQTGAA